MNGWQRNPSPLPGTRAHLFTDSTCHRDWEGPDIPSTQVFTFPLVAEELQLPLLFLIQGVAISNLHRHRGCHGGRRPCSVGFLKPTPWSFLVKRALTQLRGAGQHWPPAGSGW